MTSAYLDTSCIIYLVEGESRLRAEVMRRLANVRADANGRLVTSRLSRLECRVKPVREGNDALLRTYDAFFAAHRLMLVELDATIVEQATELRARYRFRTPDALHLATALQTQADVFLTGDKELARFDQIPVDLIDPSL